jgi:hypothetical protein
MNNPLTFHPHQQAEDVWTLGRGMLASNPKFSLKSAHRRSGSRFKPGDSDGMNRVVRPPNHGQPTTSAANGLNAEYPLPKSTMQTWRVP